MPPSIALSSYTLRIRDKSTNKYVKMNEINQNEDALTTIESFLNHFKSNTDDDNGSKKLFRVDTYQLNKDFKHETINYRVKSGIVKSGNYGYESDLEPKTGGGVSHHRTTEEAEMLPFYFLLAVPDNADEGIVILQSYMQYSIKTVFRESINKYFVSNKPEYEIEINDLVPEELFKILLESGKISKLIYTRFDLGSDIADGVYNEGHSEKRIPKVGKKRKNAKKEKKEEIKAELILTEKTGILSPIIKSIKNKFPYRIGQPDDPLKKLIEIVSFEHFEYDTIKIQIRAKGRNRTIDLGDLNNMRPSINITEDIRILKSGHPEFDSINSYATRLFEDLAVALDVESDGSV